MNAFENVPRSGDRDGDVDEDDRADRAVRPDRGDRDGDADGEEEGDLTEEVDRTIPICEDCGGILVPGYEHTHHCSARQTGD